MLLVIDFMLNRGYNADYKEEKIGEWGKIPVPSCWQTYGYDKPNYTNINYPFSC